MTLQKHFNYNSKISETLFNDSPISIFILNNEGKIIRANQCAIDLLDTDYKEIESKSIFDLFPNVNLIFPKTWWQKLYYTNKKEIITKIINDRNEAISIKIQVQLNIDIDLHLIYVSEITEPIYLENNLLKSEDKLAAYFDCSNDLISILSPQTMILSFNKLFEHYIKIVFI